MNCPVTGVASPGTKSSYFCLGPFVWNAQSAPWSFHTASASGAMYEYSCDCDGLFVNVSSPDSMTTSSNPGIGTEFSWLWRPMPQIGRFVPDLTS